MSESLMQKLARLEDEVKELRSDIGCALKVKPVIDTDRIEAIELSVSNISKSNKASVTTDIKKLIVDTINEVVTEPYITSKYRNK